MTGKQDGDERRFVLPWSGLGGAASGVRWQMRHPWNGRTPIVPQVPVVTNAADYFAGRDPVLETTLARIGRDAQVPPVR